ncbi:hypothetical protein ABPG75_000255 [Micractinium tetrahymenae]
MKAEQMKQPSAPGLAIVLTAGAVAAGLFAVGAALRKQAEPEAQPSRRRPAPAESRGEPALRVATVAAATIDSGGVATAPAMLPLQGKRVHGYMGLAASTFGLIAALVLAAFWLVALPAFAAKV